MAEKINDVVNEPIDRAPAFIPEAAFGRLLTLHNKHEWLLRRSAAFLELWNCCETEEEQDLVYSLVDRFEYFSADRLEECALSVAEYISKTKSPGRRGIVIAISDDGHADGSQYVLQLLKNHFADQDGWNEDNFFSNYSTGRDALETGDFVVLLDDFIGTGQTITRKYKAMSDSLKQSGKTKMELVACAFAGMNFAQQHLLSEGVSYFCPNWLAKGIADHFEGAELKTAEASMSRLEMTLKEKYKRSQLHNFSFGYGRSEALFCTLTNNVPNNVFPIFWWPEFKDKSKRKTMFRRLPK